MAEQKILIVLVSNGVSDVRQATNQRNVRTLLTAKKTPYIEVDGMDPSHRESRNELFAISGIRGNYPQFFFVHPDGSTSFYGGYDKVSEVNEATGIPDDILEQNPEIETWPKVFGTVVATFD